MKKIKCNKKIIVVLCIIFIILFLLIMQKNKFIIGNLIKLKQEITEDEISYIIYDNAGDKIKTLVIIQREDGIEKVEYEGNVINCNGKTKISLDREFEKDIEYEFKVTSKGKEKTEKISINEDNIKNYAQIIKLEPESDEYTKINIEYKNEKDDDTKYYKIGENNKEWIKYTGEISLNLGDVETIDYENQKCIANIYTKKVDKAGNIVLTSQKCEVESTVFDVFENVKITGKTLYEYGFTPSWSNCQNADFSINNLGAGHWENHASYSGLFKLDWKELKTIKASEIYTGIYSYSEGGGSWVASSMTLAYSDDATDFEQLPTNNSDRWRFDTSTIYLQQDKEISYVQFYIWRL